MKKESTPSSEQNGIFQLAAEMVERESVSITAKELLEFIAKHEGKHSTEQESQEEIWKELLDYVESQRPYVSEMMKMYTITRKP